MSAALGVAGLQLEQLRSRYPAASAEARPDGTILIVVPEVPLPPGWNQGATVVRFLVPVGYPAAKPDCFFADGSLRLANGSMPSGANVQIPPGAGETCVWFSWHLATWNPAQDTLLTYLRVASERFKSAQ